MTGLKHTEARIIFMLNKWKANLQDFYGIQFILLEFSL